MNIGWDKLLTYAYESATHSPDPSTQNGALLVKGKSPVGAWAYNRFPAGVEVTDERLERPLKYSFIEHAERGAIYAAAKAGIKTDGLTMVCCWAACSDCAKALVEAGVVRLVRHMPPADDEATKRWLASIEIGDTILREGGVEITDFTDQIPEAPMVLRDGELWRP